MNKGAKKYQGGWQRHNEILKTLDVNNLEFLSHPLITNSMATPLAKNMELCESRVKNLFSYFDLLDNISILEIGGGYGSMCKVVKDHITCDYTLLDIEGMLECAKAFLGMYDVTCNFVMNTEYENLFGKKFDLILSYFCLNETPKKYELAILDNIFINAEKCVVITKRDDDDIRIKLPKLYSNYKIIGNAESKKFYDLFIGWDRIWE